MTKNTDERQRLEREIARLQAQLAKLESSAETRSAQAGVTPVRRVRGQNVPLRTWLLEVLADARTPLYSQYLTSLYFCRFGTTLAAGRLGTLSVDERDKIEGGRARDPALVHGLVAGRGTPIKRLWARSDWDFADRVVVETSGRVLFLKTAIWVFDEAAGGDAKWANLDALSVLADQLARDVPIESRSSRDFRRWAELARNDLARLDGADRERRATAANLLRGALNQRQQLLGASDSLIVIPGTEEQAWKDAKG